MWNLGTMAAFIRIIFHSSLIWICYGQREVSKKDLVELRQRTKDMFYHAYHGYMTHAYPHDELRPLTCDGVNTWGNYSLTLVDALDTLAVIGDYAEFRKVAKLVLDNLNPDLDVNVSVFETNIRVVGGLLSAHLLSKRAGVEVAEDWPCDGPLLKLAEKFAKKLLPAFRTPTGMPYGTVNLLRGVALNETPETCTAAVGTYIVEFGTLSRLTGNLLYENVALKAIRALNASKSEIGLLGNHINVVTGKWTAVDAGIGAGVDSFFEYLVKGANLLFLPELMELFKQFLKPIRKYIQNGDWNFWVNMKSGSVTMPVFQSLEAFWPGTEVLTGNIEQAYKTLRDYLGVWHQYGMTPEFFSISHRAPVQGKEGYPLRPELIESIMYTYAATKDPDLLYMGKRILHSIESVAKTKCGYATIKNVRDHTLENRMESFFVAETVKYLYLLFDPDNFLHASGHEGEIWKTKNFGECIIQSGGYVFNTEAHPIDISALHCCSKRETDKDVADMLESLQIDAVSSSKNSHTNTTVSRGSTTPSVLSCPVPSPYHKLYAYGEVWSGV